MWYPYENRLPNIARKTSSIAFRLCICYYACIGDFFMRRTTIMLPDLLKSKANRKALKNNISLGELIRLTLERECANDRSDTINQDPFFTDQHFCKDKTPRDIALNHDDYLY